MTGQQVFDDLDSAQAGGLGLDQLEAALRQLRVFSARADAAGPERALLQKLEVAFDLGNAGLLDYHSFEGLLLRVFNGGPGPFVPQSRNVPWSHAHLRGVLSAGGNDAGGSVEGEDWAVANDGEPSMLELVPPDILDMLLEAMSAMHAVNKHAYGDHHTLRSEVFERCARVFAGITRFCVVGHQAHDTQEAKLLPDHQPDLAAHRGAGQGRGGGRPKA